MMALVTNICIKLCDGSALAMDFFDKVSDGFYDKISDNSP